jgi:aralkylamine N-acetyltransferase
MADFSLKPSLEKNLSDKPLKPFINASLDNDIDIVQIRTIKSASIQELKQLYAEAGWWEPAWDKNHDFLHSIVKDSAIFVGAFLDSKLIGMGRALSDLASDAYIQDVTVLKNFRGQGTGRKIIQKIIKLLKADGVDWIGIVAQPGTLKFYEQLGFKPLKDHIPLKFGN